MMDDEKNAINIIVLSEEIRKEIENILHTRFEVFEDFDLKGNDYAFFGLHNLLSPRELTYLAYMLEAQHGICFGMEEYDDPRFYNLGGLSEIVAEMIMKNPAGRYIE